MPNRNILRSALLLLSLALFSAATASATTYYIDFSAGSDSNSGTGKTAPWKRAPGMTGFAGAPTKSSGDVFVFKGGVTWTGSFPWTFSGASSGSAITYTTDHTWFTGSSFTQPIFDDQAAHPGGVGMANATSTGFITLNDLKFINCGTSQVANSDKCLVFTNTHDITITNCTFATESWISVYFPFNDGASHSNFTWTGNDFSHTSGAIWFASTTAKTTMHNITYNSNTFHDYASQIGGGVHGDGAWHGFVIPSTDATQVMDNMQFCNNRFYGDFRNSFAGGGAMTAFFFQEAALQNAVICNNDMSFSPVQANMFDGLIVLDGKNNTSSRGVQIYNNSMANIGANAESAAIHLVGGYNNIIIKNNIASGMQYAMYVEDSAGSGTTLITDYNLWSSSSGQLVFGAAFQSYAQWQAAGRDTHSVLGSDPSWVSAPGNEHLHSNSPAIGRGVNLCGLGIAILNSDHDGNGRPPNSSWDIGVYKFAQNNVLPPQQSVGKSKVAVTPAANCAAHVARLRG